MSDTSTPTDAEKALRRAIANDAPQEEPKTPTEPGARSRFIANRKW